MARSRASSASQEPLVVKTTGESQPFDERKLRSSLRRSGASKTDIDRVVSVVRGQLRSGMTTRRLYQIAHRTLRKAPRSVAARYSLQRALLELGPTGYPFERFVGELFRHQGFRVRVGSRLKGRFASHEIDVVATRRRERMLMECKFRVQPNAKIDLKTALYVHARSLDLQGQRGGYTRFWLVTNARFTKDARVYGEGVGLYMLSWEHPKGESLRERVDRAGLHPITCLTGLRKREKQALLQQGHVLVRDFAEKPKLLERMGISAHRLHQIRAEVELLCGTHGMEPAGAKAANKSPRRRARRRAS